MKKILFILLAATLSLFAKPCTTDIYFGNGVWNSKKQANYNRDKLKEFLLGTQNVLDPQKEGIEYNFKLAYNPSHGAKQDLIETFWQLRESGQISDGFFMFVYSTLSAESDYVEYLKMLDSIVTDYAVDAEQMYKKYKAESFDRNSNVILVAHSQGNLFGNKMYTLFSDKEKSRFRMISVATPANRVAGSGPYVTATGDLVIKAVPGALKANVNGFGHTFIGTYLNLSYEAPVWIAKFVKSAYDNLADTVTCSLYEYIFFRVYDTSRLEVVGYTLDPYPHNEVVATEPIEGRSVSSIDQCDNGNAAIYGAPPAFALISDYAVWQINGGRFTSSAELINYNGEKSTTYFHPGIQSCATISLNGKIYDAALGALQ